MSNILRSSSFLSGSIEYTRGDSMENIITVGAVVLSLTAMAEIFIIFFRLPEEDSAPPYVIVLPVFSGDSGFPARLEQLSLRSGGRSNILLVCYSADSSQIELCKQFVRANPDAVIITGSQLEKYLSETFAFSDKM